MAEHNLFLGGLATMNGHYRGLPSVEQTPNGAMTPTTHKQQGRYSLLRDLAWKDDTGGPSTGESRGSRFLADYLSCNTLAVGDVLNLVIMPKWSSILGIWWMVHDPLPGFTFDLRLRGNANSLGGTPAVPVPLTLATGVDGGLVAPVAAGPGYAPTGLIGIDPAAQGDPLAPGIYFDQNDMLQLVITGLPPEGIACSRICIAPVMETYCEGSY